MNIQHESNKEGKQTIAVLHRKLDETTISRITCYKYCVHCGETRPGASQAFVTLLGNGANQRIFRRFIVLSYATLDPERVICLSYCKNQMK